MKNIVYFALVFLFFSCKKEEIKNEASEEYPGGSTTYNNIFSGAFEQPSSNLNSAEFTQHAVGDAHFDANFVTSPAIRNQGLGPVFNHISCVVCHPKNGKSPQPFSGDDLKGLLFRISIPGAGIHGEPAEVPGFGGQLQNKANVGKQAEVDIQIAFTESTYFFVDGTQYSLRKPSYTLTNSYIPIPANVLVSPRLGQQVIGLGLLEAIPDNILLAKEDISDADGDGISGKANKVWNPVTQQTEVGRFGWKAGNPNLLLQAASALHQDIGITSWIFTSENSFGQTQYDGLNDEPEVDSQLLADLTFYTQTLAVPKRRDFNNPEVLSGKQLFFNIGCQKCHSQKYTTGDGATPSVSNQTIYPYTDLLLHDMGPELADNRADFLANGTEWRTPPLWGIGLTQLVNGHSNLLHDGRARSILEAIMWHGGEAEKQKIAVSKLSKKEREQLVRFVGSL